MKKILKELRIDSTDIMLAVSMILWIIMLIVCRDHPEVQGFFWFCLIYLFFFSIYAHFSRTSKEDKDKEREENANEWVTKAEEYIKEHLKEEEK